MSKIQEGDSATQSTLKKCGCRFKIKPTLFIYCLRWKIDVKYVLHNHNFSNRFECHAFVGCLSENERKHVDSTKSCVPSRYILLSFQERDPKIIEDANYIE